MYYKVILQFGHVGAGKSFEVVRYFKSDDVNALLSRLREQPCLKDKSTLKSISLVEEISAREYERAIALEEERAQLSGRSSGRDVKGKK